MRGRLAVLVGMAFAGCGGRVVLDGGSSGVGGGSPDAGPAADAGDGGDSDAADARPPVPSCTGSDSECVMDSAGNWSGASVITCDPVYFVGPWNLLLERSILSQFQVVQTEAVQEPGFGWTFYDGTGPPTKLTYRVCVVDAIGTRCDAPFTTAGPVDCLCEPFTCESLLSCNTVIDDACGHMIECGGCSDGSVCNPANMSCCGPGLMPNGDGTCICAPPGPCGAWNVVDCRCEPAEG